MSSDSRAPSRPPRPLDGITVVAIEHAIAAPYCTRQLADLGARVIKVERPGTGDFARQYDSRVNGLASHFVWTNRSKESIALDVKNAEARAILGELVARADVLVQNLAPGAADRLGLGYEALKQAHPRLIVCDISGYGNSGPYVGKKAYDLLIQSESGFLSVTGTGEQPCKAGISIADISAGMYAYSSILSALLQRERTGRGAHIDVSLFETSVEWMGFPLYYAYQGAPPPPRTAAAHATIYPYGPFTAGDGRQVMLGLQNEREWVIFCEQVLRTPQLARQEEFSSNALRVASRGRLESIIIEAFSRLDAAEVVARLDAAGIANARINTVADVWAHPQLAARRRWSEVDTPTGRVPALKPPAMLDGIEARMDKVPALGEHTADILRELGVSTERIGRLRRDRAVQMED
ncbi:MAG TPA: CaiB/BaiF CoA-transferase family protein [Steroidobacteraceae bacterium]|nr:CaiB/BaiF CoA-transferase family protein [Steroidobacteraceae bacterium]